MSARVKRTSDGIWFTCPGCGDAHMIPIEGMAPPGRHAWTWNGSLDAPTITPSIDVKVGHYVSTHQEGDPCWCGKGYGVECYRCHSTVAEGRITFCSDSTHKLAGQTVDLPEVT
jgi:hypothetical protein